MTTKIDWNRLSNLIDFFEKRRKFTITICLIKRIIKDKIPIEKIENFVKDYHADVKEKE